MTSHPKHAVPEHDILDLIRRRWSPRAFDASRPIERAELRRVFEAARWAPSSFNDQPWRFVVADRWRTPESFAAMFDTLDASNRAWAGQAAVLALVVTARHLKRTGAPNRNAWYDAGQAVAFLSLQATSVGLGLRQMEGFDRDRARERFGVPDGFEPLVMMAIGYPGDPETLSSERHRAAEVQPRSRQPVAEFTFEGAWGVPLE
jgi:nitroreductase